MRHRQSRRSRRAKRNLRNKVQDRPPDVMLWSHWTDSLREKIKELELKRMQSLEFKTFKPELAMVIAHKIRKYNEEINAFYWSRNKSKDEILNEILKLQSDIEQIIPYQKELFVRRIISLKQARIDGLNRSIEEI